MQLIEIYNHITAGYHPLLIRSKWQVAKSNCQLENGVGNIHQIEVYYKTDEVFILHKGVAELIAAKKKDKELNFEMIKMVQNDIYNIPKGVWHAIAMKEEAEIILVVDVNTHLENYELYEMSEEQRKILNAAIAICINK